MTNLQLVGHTKTRILVSGTALKSPFDTVAEVETFLEKCYSFHVNKDSSSSGGLQKGGWDKSNDIAGQPTGSRDG